MAIFIKEMEVIAEIVKAVSLSYLKSAISLISVLFLFIFFYQLVARGRFFPRSFYFSVFIMQHLVQDFFTCSSRSAFILGTYERYHLAIATRFSNLPRAT